MLETHVQSPKGGEQTESSSARRGLSFHRYFTKPGVHPFDEVEWELRTAVITNERGQKVFEQKDVEIPKSWSMTATNVVVSKYFHGQMGTSEREHSVKQLIERVARSYHTWGLKGGYFATQEDADIFYNELVYLLVNQHMAFNSPVWFNVGVEEQPQCSACFINSVKDSMESILTLAKTEGMLFKFGSGTGSNLSTLRSSREQLSGGGTASGPVSFMRGFDAFAGVIKSGGKTRRAAKMVILNIDHPDIVDFINSKADEEKKAWSLIDAGYDGGFNVPGGAYDSVFFQNANHSVRVTDEFMKAVIEDKEWVTHAVTTGKPVEKLRARELMRQIADAAWICGDPGIQYDTTINAWHTSSSTAPINSSNPCSEYMFLDDTACNLASLNLMKFRRPNGEFDVESYRAAIRVTITAMEISVDNSSYPTPAITQNSHEYRPLGLGYANLGALLMSRGVAYDSDEGRSLAAALTSLMCGEAYRQSALIAKELGPFKSFEKNREPMLKVMAKHGIYAEKIDKSAVQEDLWEASSSVWKDVVKFGTQYGIRNAQATVLAPTGTIGFMMDCDTTGVEPDIALVKYKKLVGGGLMKIVNMTVPEALRKLGYDEEQAEHIVAYIDKNDTIEGAPHLKEEHLPVFDCAFKPAKGARSIQYMGHIKMMGAVQPFLSGAISKTVNMPTNVTTEDIEQAYTEAWQLGLKAIAIYRDGCKRTQPLSTSLDSQNKEEKAAGKPIPARRRLSDERQSITHKFSIAGHEGYITVGMFADGSPGEIFITMSKEGSTISGLMDSLATSVSIALQYGVPLKVMVDKFSHARYEPSGFTNNPDIPIAKSISDYLFRWLGKKFIREDGTTGAPEGMQATAAPPAEPKAILIAAATQASSSMEQNEKTVFANQADAPPCHECGAIMIRSGSCYKCLECGSTSGCS
ncbi:MAG: ribonucleoside-diphosphate reductase, adenosylcobalamin-dependent [Ignavibacteria bacterium GWA2_55_11]|nr:MAG: ribonucleoside-diphosphate reductase, adenosylcobalamin-dependent [Ignavibacteria bacterium GWA2_55_11]OGU43360.1 MAG: ribonucleoside-diphosphate reductase, adenosylcobalamin-dependent [Ignavibacteria bacterium GWC2_56_12]OGU70443.1 MAG: ribonucleoside-diphosphate reductase, adenosylcobalamin-dependent [Ignavibacteria bacterium RIFCSPLOWO2_02_FULL_55_14]OGU72556.1 MAG: ribonucleoside-diphosphate reductase, adenosylcobalamin-dependent [Ignavibacteria bacterium RIFCSPLOWO2_12_FULL_56_21]